MNARTSTRWIRKVVAVVGIAALAVTGLAGVAQAEQLPADAPAAAAAEPPPPLPSADALPTWQINGVVWSQAIIGDTVYVTGSFTRARPPGVAAGGAGEVVANNIFAYRLSTGDRVAGFATSPGLNAQGLVIRASADGSRLWVGGDFTSVNGAARGHLTALNPVNGSPVTGGGFVSPNVGGQVRGLGITPTTVFAGGNFTSANGIARTRLAAFQVGNGAMTSWAPAAAGGYVWSMTMSPDLSRVIPAGSFTTLSGQPAYGMGSLMASNATVNPWPAQDKIRAAGANGAITSIKADATQVYGSSYAFGAGADYEGTFAIDPMTGQINWQNDCLGDSYDIAASGPVLYSVSHQHDCSTIGGWPDTNPRVRWQKAAASYSYATDIQTKNDAYGWAGSHGLLGLPYAKPLHWFPDLAFGSYTSSRQAAWSVETSGDYVLLGGEFPSVNGKAQQGLTRFRGRAAAPNKSGPTYSTRPATPTPTTNAASLAAGTVRVTWGSAWDMDDPTLTYDVLRDNNTWVSSTTGSSNFWTLPKMGFIDKDLAAGSTHRYQVRITDPNGNTLWSPISNTVTVANGSTSAYAAAVTGDGAEHFWRLGESSGTAALDWAGFDDDTLSGGYTRGQAGAITGDSDAATSFDGSSGYAVNSAAVPGPDVFSQEAWFKTTSTTGGKIVSFGDKATGTSSSYDRHIYMDPEGKIWFGVYNNGSYTVNTSVSLNDGQWHHVVGTMDASGPTLFVDGKKIGHNGGTSSAQPYNGYWRIGGDSAWNGNPYFNGTIDDVAIYPTALSLTKVQQHFAAGGGNLPNQLPTASFKHSETGLSTLVNGSLSSDPDGSVASYAWNFGDGTPVVTGPAATANHTYAAAATYTVTLTVTDDKGGTNVFAESVTVTAPPANVPPTAFFTASVSELTVTLDGTGSTDSDGTVASYSWNFGDGTAVVTDPATSHKYATAGKKMITLTVTDNDGATNSVTQEAEVVAPPPNQAPTASFTAAPTGLTVNVDGSASADPDGTIQTYAWAFGDGGTADTAVAVHEYAATGTYTVKLTVTDDGGATNFHTESVSVTAPPPVNAPPVAKFTVSANGLVASVNGSGSSDQDGTIAAYTWDFGDTTSGSGAVLNHTYAAAGPYTITLTVTDNGGETNSTFKQLTVIAPGTPVALATDAFGRTVTNGLGTADLGGAWTLTGSSANASVGSGSAKLKINNAGGGPSAYLNTVSAGDVNASVDIALDKAPTGSGLYGSLATRRIGTSDYRLKVQLLPTSTRVSVSKIVNGVETVIPGSTQTVSGLTYTAGDVLRMRLQVSGMGTTKLQGKVWKVGTTEPAAFQTTVTDTEASLQGPGGVGMQAYLSGSSTNAPVVVTADNLSVTTIPKP